MNILYFTIFIKIAQSQLTREIFLEKTLSVIHKNNPSSDFIVENRILKDIYDIMTPQNIDRLILFTATALYKTSFLTVFEDQDDPSLYKGRGLLQISGLDNYKLLTRISNTNYERNVNLLSSTKFEILEDTVRFFDRILEGKEYTFDNYLGSIGYGNRLDVIQGVGNERWDFVFATLKKKFGQGYNFE